MSTRGAQHPRNFFAGPQPSRRRPLPPRAWRPRLPSARRGGASGAVPPAPTGCPRPCSPTLACWYFWEVSATVPPPPRCLRSERKGLTVRALRGPGDFCKGLRTASVTLCPARSSPGSLGRHLPHLQPPPGRCRRPRHRAKGARTPPRCAPCGACAPNTGSGPLGGTSKEIRRVPGPLNTPWQGTRGRSLRPGLQGLV